MYCTASHTHSVGLAAPNSSRTKNLGFKDRFEDIQFGNLNAWIIGVLNFFEQFSIIIENTGNAFEYQCLEYSYCKMSLSRPVAACKQGAWLFVDEILLRKKTSSQERFR